MTRPCPGAPPPSTPSFALPEGACDTHVHVMGPYDAFPPSPGRLYSAPEAPLSELTAMLETMGLQRVVVAHPSAYGSDLTITMDSTARLGGRGRSTIVLDPNASPDQVQEFHQSGVRGVRLAKSLGWDPTTEMLEAMAKLIVDMGWHISIWPSDFSELLRLREISENRGVRIVLDHMAGHCWSADQGLGQEGFRTVLDMLKSDRIWLKISGMYRVSAGPAPWPELIPFGRELVQQRADRLLWASDWPHVAVFGGNIPQSHELLEWLVEIGCDAPLRQKILSQNPRHLYGFS